MPEHSPQHPPRVLYVVACAAPPARDVLTLAGLAQHAGWDVCVISTPRAFRWLDAPAVIERTGHPVRHDYKLLGEPDLLPAPDAMIVAPATFNTINKWAAGIADTLALGLLTEGIGLGLPIVVLPYLNSAQAAHPAFHQSLQRLRDCGVHVLFGPDVLPLHEPGKGKHRFPWHLTLHALHETIAPPRTSDSSA